MMVMSFCSGPYTQYMRMANTILKGGISHLDVVIINQTGLLCNGIRCKNFFTNIKKDVDFLTFIVYILLMG